MVLSTQELDQFHSAVQSLKLYRRAELLEDDGTSLIEDLYVDPLPNNHILNTILKPNTTFIIGRKGTGKSTVFQRAQHALRSKSTYASAYIDIKTIFESSQVDPASMSIAALPENVMPREALERLLLHKAFLAAVIVRIKEDLQERIRDSVWARVRETFQGSLQDLFRELDDLIREADTDRFMSLLAVRELTVDRKNEMAREASTDNNTLSR